MQPCEVTAQEREARARELRGGGEVEHAERFAQVDVVLHREIECARRPVSADFDIVVGRAANRRRWVGDVRQPEQKIAQLRLHVVELALESLQFIAEAGNVAQQRLGIFPAALGDADLPRQRVALRLQLLRERLDALALGLERFEARAVERDATLLQRSGDASQISAQRVDVEHRTILAVHFSSSEGGGRLPPAFSSRARNARSFSAMRASRPRSVGA